MKCPFWPTFGVALLIIVFINTWTRRSTLLYVRSNENAKAVFSNYGGLLSRRNPTTAHSSVTPSHNAMLYLIIQFPVILDRKSLLANTSALLMARQQEYIDTLQINLQHSCVLEVHILYENVKDPKFIQDLNLKDANKLRFFHLGRRLHYTDALEYASLYLLHKTSVIINADCYIGNGFEKLDHNILRARVVYALTRHETPDRMRNCNTHDLCGPGAKYIGSHDAFVFHLSSPIPKLVLDKTHFRPDMVSIERVVIYNLRQYGGFTVRNPCRILHIVHNHCSRLRLKQKRFVGGQRLDKYLRMDGIPWWKITAPFSDL